MASRKYDRPRIVLIGFRGLLLAPLLREIELAGWAPTAFELPRRERRNEDDRRKVLDLRDPDSLKEALGGADALALHLEVDAQRGPHEDQEEREGLEILLATASQAGVPRLLYVSSRLALRSDDPWWVLEIHRAALRRVRACGIPSLLFFPTRLMESLAENRRKGEALRMSGPSKKASFWLAGEDFARQLAASLALRPAPLREYVMQGPEALTTGEAIDEIASAVRNLPVHRRPLFFDRIAALLSARVESRLRRQLAEEALSEPFEAAATWRDLGRPRINLATFSKSLVR